MRSHHCVSAAGLSFILPFVLAFLAAVPQAEAQYWPRWANGAFGPSYEQRPDAWRGRDNWQERDYYDQDRDAWRRPTRPAPNPPRDLTDGGPRSEIMPVTPPIVGFQGTQPANSIVIDTAAKKLFFVLPGNRAYAYDISVGREGFAWTGTEKVSRKQAWPDWYPPAEMRQRDPRLPVKMTGGLRNPLGAMALYLGNTLYRIHGTNDVRSIGRAESSGCFRMMNSAVMHLASITPVGTTVTVTAGLPATVVSRQQDIYRAPPAVPRPVTRRIYQPQSYPPEADEDW